MLYIAEYVMLSNVETLHLYIINMKSSKWWKPKKAQRRPGAEERNLFWMQTTTNKNTSKKKLWKKVEILIRFYASFATFVLSSFFVVVCLVVSFFPKYNYKYNLCPLANDNAMPNYFRPNSTVNAMKRPVLRIFFFPFSEKKKKKLLLS